MLRRVLFPAEDGPVAQSGDAFQFARRIYRRGAAHGAQHPAVVGGVAVGVAAREIEIFLGGDSLSGASLGCAEYGFALDAARPAIVGLLQLGGAYGDGGGDSPCCQAQRENQRGFASERG